MKVKRRHGCRADGGGVESRDCLALLLLRGYPPSIRIFDDLRGPSAYCTVSLMVRQRDVDIYVHQLVPLGYGYALFEPNPNGSYDKVRVGDVGYVMDGKFMRLFNTFHHHDHAVNMLPGTLIPAEFQPIDEAFRLTDRREELSPGCRSSTSVISTRIQAQALVQAQLCVPLIE